MEMIDVITKLREIADNSPEIKQALDNTTRLSAQRVEEGVQITVSGSDAVLHQILKLAGMIGAECVEEESMEEEADAQRPYQQSPDDTYGAATSPDEVVLDFETAVPSGSDLHRAKGTYPKVAGGDNPMQDNPFGV
jgi:hypothetical protein